MFESVLLSNKKEGKNKEMTQLKNSKYIITDHKPLPADMREKMEAELSKYKGRTESLWVATLDDEVIPGAFYVDCHWISKWPSEDTLEKAHWHDFVEVLVFIGCNQEDPHDLGGEVSIWLDEKKEVLTRSCIVFVPQGTKHCPIQFNRIERPIFFMTMAPVKKYQRTDEGDKATEPPKDMRDASLPKYTIITETKARPAPPPDAPRRTMVSDRILHLEDDIAKGSFYADFVWIWQGSGVIAPEGHSHDFEEVIALIGADHEKPRSLGGDISIKLGDETHKLTQSSLVFIPKGMNHCPLTFSNIEKPVLCFTAGTASMYSAAMKK